MTLNIAEQIELLKRGTVEVFRSDELAQRLTESQKTGKPLRIKLGMDPTAPELGEFSLEAIEPGGACNPSNLFMSGGIVAVAARTIV